MSAFASGIVHQATPGVAEYPRYDVDIVSPELPCGTAWLVNCLLKLGVPAWKPWNSDVAGEWESLGAHRYRYAAIAEPWNRTLPALKHDRIFDFRTKPVPRVQHVWPHFYPPTERTILFVRDPRDALYSTWQRARSAGTIAADLDFAAFACGRYFHYPLSRVEYILLFLRLWRDALCEREHLVLRFEDYRCDAIATLRRAATFLRIDADDAALEHATRASDFQVVQRIETDLRDGGAAGPILNRAGRAYEYRDTFDAPMHAAFDARFSAICDWLGYESASLAAAAPVTELTQDAEPLLEAMSVPLLPASTQNRLRVEVMRATVDIPLDRWTK